MREQYAFWSAAAITGMIALVWAVSLQYQFDAPTGSEELITEEHQGAFADFMGEAKDNLGNVFSAFETVPEPAAGGAETNVERAPLETDARAEYGNAREPFGPAPRASSSRFDSEPSAAPASSAPRTVLIATSTEPR